VARPHRVPALADDRFIRRGALIDDLAEAGGWLMPYLSGDRVPAPLHNCFARILHRAEADADRYADRFPAPFALVHTDVQAHNFIVSKQSAAGRIQTPYCRLPTAYCSTGSAR
jgi:hypothetical protein